MSWSSGSRLFGDLIDQIEEHIPDRAARVALYIGMIWAFRDHDCDTLDECLSGMDDAFTEAYREVWPPEEDDDEE